MKNHEPKIADANESGWILVTKFWTPKCYDNQKYQWKDGTEEEILENCDTLVSYYLFITRGFGTTHDGQHSEDQPAEEYVKLFNINYFLLKIAKKFLDKEDYFKILENLNRSRNKLSPAQGLFLELYGAIQHITVHTQKEDNSTIDLIQLDLSNMIVSSEQD